MGNSNSGTAAQSGRTAAKMTPAGAKMAAPAAAVLHQPVLASNSLSPQDNCLNPALPQLTCEERALIKRSWAALESDPVAVGILTFSKFFELNPEVVGMFKILEHLSAQDLNRSQELRQHAARVMGFVNKIVMRLDNEEELVPIMKEFGLQHMVYGANPEYVEVMGDQFLSVIKNLLSEAGNWNPQAESAWRKMFKILSMCVPERRNHH